MRRCAVIGTSALALLAGISMAAAQGMGATSAARKYQPAADPGQTQSSQSQISQNSLSLNEQQKQTIWQTLSKARAEAAPADFQASVGADVPKSLRLHYFTRSVTRQVPAMHGYEYAKLQNEVLIVNPRTRKVVDTANGG